MNSNRKRPNSIAVEEVRDTYISPLACAKKYRSSGTSFLKGSPAGYVFGTLSLQKFISSMVDSITPNHKQ